MKVEIIIDSEIKDTIIKIYSNNYTKDLENLKNSLENINKDVIVGYKDDDIYVLEASKIIRIYAEDKNVFIESVDGIYKARLRIYEIENKLNKNEFIKISRSEIVNLTFVKKLDLSFQGTICIEFKNGNVSYVSRRQLKNFKSALGI